MNLLRRQAQMRQRQEAIRFQLVATELDLAITFCRVATTTNDPARYDRNIANAQQAYSAAVRFLRYNRLKAPMELEISKKLNRLSFLLAGRQQGLQ